MPLDATQILNNLKRSFNAYLATALEGSSINFDEDPFETAGLESWYAVRYTGLRSESSGMGELIEEDESTEGRFHALNCEVSVWSRDDPQRATLGDMVDKLIVLVEEASISLYDYSDPENPVECGKIYIHPQTGSFTPKWAGGGPVLKSSSDKHAQGGITGFVLEIELITLAEVS